MNIKDLWIGESVRIKTSGKTGRFEGINHQGKARISVDQKILLVAAENLEVLPEKEYFPDINDYLKEQVKQEKKESVKPKIKLNHTLDLHIEKLAPAMQHEGNGRILDFQLEKSEAFIRQAIDHKFPHITIIHGKGQGILKQAIEHQLTLFHQVKITFSKNGGGAIEVWL